MLQYYAKKSFNEDPQLVKEAPMERAWVYGASITDQELSTLAEHYGLDAGILKDVHDKNELPRVEFSQGAAYVFVRAPRETSRGTIATTPFLAILKGTLLVTLSSKEYVRPKDLFEHTKVDMKSTKHVFLQLVNYVVLQYQQHIHATGAQIRRTDQRLRTHEVDNKDFINFVNVEHDLNEYRTNLTGLEALLHRLCENKHDIFSNKDCEFIEDIILHVRQLLVSAESHLSTVGSIRNAYATISNNGLNKRMKQLTLLTLLVALPNVFYGMYGMNVVLPFADQQWAYSAITGTSLIIVLIVVLIVRKIKF